MLCSALRNTAIQCLCRAAQCHTTLCLCFAELCYAFALPCTALPCPCVALSRNTVPLLCATLLNNAPLCLCFASHYSASLRPRRAELRIALALPCYAWPLQCQTKHRLALPLPSTALPDSAELLHFTPAKATHPGITPTSQTSQCAVIEPSPNEFFKRTF